MPTPDDTDPVQDRKAAREAAGGATVSELYRAWAEAERRYHEAVGRAEAAKLAETDARNAVTSAEQVFGAAVSAAEGGPKVPGQHGRTILAVAGDQAVRVQEWGNEADGWRYHVRPEAVVKLTAAVGAAVVPQHDLGGES